MTQTCQSCKYWTAEPDWLKDGIQTGDCGSPMVIQPNYGPLISRHMIPAGVLTCDEGGGTGVLTTGPEFGCVNYKEAK